MANTVSTRTTADDLLKQTYASSITKMTKEQFALLSLLETKLGTRSDWGGESFIISLEPNNMGSTGDRGEDGTLPDAMPASWLRAIVPIYSSYFAISVSGLAMATSGQSIESFANIWAREALVKTRAFRQHTNRKLNGDGTAILAQVDGAISIGGTNTTITLDNAYGLSGFNNSDVNGHRFISPGMKVDFYSGSTLRDSGSCTILSVTPGAFPSTSATITVVNAEVASVADGDYMYVAGSKGYEFPGMRALIDDGTVSASFQSLSSTTYPEWKSSVAYGSTAGTAEAWTSARMQNLEDEVESYGGGMIDAYLTSNAVWLTVGEAMRSEGITVNPKKLDTGFTVVEFNGKPIYKDPYSLDHIYAIDKRAIKLFEAMPMGWLDWGDSGPIVQDGSKDNWKAYWGWYMTPGIMNRAWCGKMVDISVVSNKI
jgi:hypothetical protein